MKPSSSYRLDAAFAAELDAQDPLASFRSQFVIDEPHLIYLDGNSLGRLPKRTAQRLQTLVETEWGSRLIRSWNESWFDLPHQTGAKIARLLGAQEDEVVVADSTSVNLYKLVMAALAARPGRHKIVTDDLNFPSDLYILQGAIDLAGRDHSLRVISSPDGIHGPVDKLAEAIDDDTVLVTLSHTAFKSAFTYDMKEITALAHRRGALALWDLSHSAGALPIALNASEADLAVGCSYKYLNGGPGAPAFLYARRDLQDQLRNPITGWLGQHKPFDFSLTYDPAAGLQRMLTGTPPMLSLAAIEIGVDLLLEAGLERLRAKSIEQTEYLIALWKAELQPLGFHLRSPRAPDQRGSHISLGHEEGLSIDQALIHDMNVLPDFRQPDNIRLGIAPIYTSFQDIYQAVHRLRTVVTDQIHRRYAQHRPAIT